jgi:meso-butanediol dehydrogenase / (S,S)-butanediol dehydrogenase / diacetyl reductase
MRLEGKVALVTGATRGIGVGISRQLALEGAKVAVVGRNAPGGEAVAEAIRAGGGEAAFIGADISIEEDVKRAVDRTVERFGALHILVNNAAPMDLLMGGGDQPLVDQPTDAMEAMLGVMLYGVMWCCKYAIPHLAAAGGGAIISSSSVNAVQGQPAMPTYTAAKGAINALSRQLAVDYAKDNIRVNTMVLGPLDNERLDALPIPGVREVFESLQLTRLPTPDDCGRVAVFLASEDAACITGQTLAVDGGATIKGGLPLDEVVKQALAKEIPESVTPEGVTG